MYRYIEDKTSLDRGLYSSHEAITWGDEAIDIREFLDLIPGFDIGYNFNMNELLSYVEEPIIIELDEDQHKYTSCDEKRMMELFQDLGNRQLVLIRINPDKYNKKGKMKSVLKELKI